MAGGVTACRHCGEEIVPCGYLGLGCWAHGWKHLRWIDSMPVGSHYCGGRSINPLAEPEAAADPAVPRR
jgi:hypothetical protein